MEAADDICYAVLDLEDGIEIGMLPYETVEPLLLKICGNPELVQLELAAAPSMRRKMALLRGKVVDRCVREVADAFVRQQHRLLEGSYQGDLLNDCPGFIRAKALARPRSSRAGSIFNAHKVEVEVGAFTCLDILLDAFCTAAYQLKVAPQMPYRMQRIHST